MSGIPAFSNHYGCAHCGHEWTGEARAGKKGYCVECRRGSCAPYFTEEAPLFRNYYRCWRCGYKWADEWTCGCEDECPECDARACTPWRSRPLNEPAIKLGKAIGSDDVPDRRVGF